MSGGNEFVIASNPYPAQLVKSRFMKINYLHVQYVLMSMQNVTGKIHNIRKYLLAVLFNAPATMESYFNAEVTYNQGQYVSRTIE